MPNDHPCDRCLRLDPVFRHVKVGYASAFGETESRGVLWSGVICLKCQSALEAWFDNDGKAVLDLTRAGHGTGHKADPLKQG